jgi:hypothetical protein
MSRLALAAAGLVIALTCAACDRSPGEQPATPAATASPTAPPTARADMERMLRDDLEAARHRGDGGGRVRLLDGGDAVARRPGRWHFEFETGPEGIEENGLIFFQVSPFWDWSSPQAAEPAAPGFTTVTTDAEGVDLDVGAFGEGLLGMRVTGARLRPGTRVEIVYGAGEAGAVADRYAERDSVFWFAVDADGDGVRKLLGDCPAIDVAPGEAAQMVAHWPSVARPGDQVRLTLAILDAAGSTGLPVTGDVTVVDPPSGIVPPTVISLSASDLGRLTVSIGVAEPGVYRLHLRGPGGLEAETNPLQVADAAPRVLWADLHGHSNFSDGTGVPDEYFRYARDVAGLDVVALTDHDHWGMRFLDATPALWEDILATAARFHEPGRFVTLPGYEWTSWLYGHRHVLYFDDGPYELLSSLEPRFAHPTALWRALTGRDALTIAHHSAGGPVATDWTIAPDPRLEPVTEVVSVHGSSEAADSPSRIYRAIEGNYVRDALARGYRLGFIGSGDGHDGHPGLTHLAGPTGGLAAIVADENTRPAVLEALRARRVYATSGARIVLRFTIDGVPMGAGMSPGGPDTTHQAVVQVLGTAPLARLDLVRTGEVIGQLRDAEGSDTLASFEIPALHAGDYVYVRVVQQDGALAWSSPIFVDAPAP